MNVFITGATGLVGSHLVSSLLASGDSPVCLVRDGVPSSLYESKGLRSKCITVRGDISDINLLERTLIEYEIDTVYHLAAQTIVRYGQEGPVSTFEANIRGTWNVLEACRRKSNLRRVVVASSDKAYGNQPPPYVETMRLAGSYPYDVSKSCADLIAWSYHESYKLPVTIVRCSNLYGAGDLNWSRIVPRTLRFSMVGDVDLKLRGRGLMKRDYLHIDDAVAAYRMVAAQSIAEGKAYNFGSGLPTDAATLTGLLLKLIGHDGPEPVTLADDDCEISHQWMDSRQAEEDLGWHPSIALSDGLTRTAAWYREFFNRKGVPCDSLA